MGAISLRQSSERYGLALAVAAGLVARLGLITALFRWNAVWDTDDAIYAGLARGILETGTLWSHHFPVGYPFFVALVLKLSGGSFAAVRGAHVLLGLVTIVVLARMGSLLYGRRAGLMAAWIAALYPPLVFMTGRIMSETLFIALLVLSLHRFLLSDRKQHLRQSALGGALFGLSSLVRSNLMLMLAFVPLWLLRRPAASLRARLGSAALGLAAASVILVLPGLYFLATKGEFIPLATNGGQTFYGANNPLADGGWVQVEDHPELLRSIPEGVRRSAAAYGAAQFHLGLRWIRENPRAFLWLLPKKLGNAWVPGLQRSESTSSSTLALLIYTLSSGLLLTVAVVGRVLVRPAQRDGILLAVPATYTLMSIAFYGNPRIGLFCAPILILYAASLLGPLLASLPRLCHEAGRRLLGERR